jgi:hypothetical protein
LTYDLYLLLRLEGWERSVLCAHVCAYRCVCGCVNVCSVSITRGIGGLDVHPPPVLRAVLVCRPRRLLVVGVVMTTVGVTQGLFGEPLQPGAPSPPALAPPPRPTCPCVPNGLRHGAACVAAVRVPAAVMLVGAIALLPGAYQSWVLFQTWKRKPGYRVEETYEMVDL